MKTVAQTAGVLSKLQMKNSVATWSLRSAQSKFCLYSTNRSAAHQGAAASSYMLTGKRFITKDSWGASGLIKKGEILTSIDHKENIFIDANYMEGKPPAEVLRICNKILDLNVKDYYALMNNVTARIGYSDEDFLEIIAAKRSKAGAGGSNVEVVEEVVAEPVKEKEFFDIKLTAVDPKSKIKIIKEVRALTGLGLKEAKDLVEKAPVVIKQGIKKEELEAMKKILLDVGAEIEII